MAKSGKTMGDTGTKWKELATSGLAGFSASSLRVQAHTIHFLSRGKADPYHKCNHIESAKLSIGTPVMLNVH